MHIKPRTARLRQPAKVAKVIFSRDREKAYRDRLPNSIEVRLSLDGQHWTTVSKLRAKNVAAFRPTPYAPPVALPESTTPENLVRYAFLCERATWNRISKTDHLSPLVVDRPAQPGGSPYWSNLAQLDCVARTLLEFGELLERFGARGAAFRGQ